MSNAIDGRTAVYGLIGNPVEHTLSPLIHNTLAECMNINMSYVAFPVENGLGTAVEGAYNLGIKGMNVTVPYKTEVMQYLSDIDPLAQRIGAVNTLVRDYGGYKGYNTDMPGLSRALRMEGVKIDGGRFILLGAGGAARAVACMLVSEGAREIYVVNRTYEKAAAIAELSDMIVALGTDSIDEIPGDGRYTFIQCTSLGLRAGDGLLIDDDSFYDMADYGFDLIYNPAVTPFMRKLQEMSVPCSNGLGMLLYQGVIAYEYWNGVSVPDEISGYVYTVLRRRLYGENVVLTGYMGSGKTTVGREIAKRRGMTFLDTDELIVDRTGKSIPEIFSEVGESGFRDIETDVLRELRQSAYNTVIATGGGIVLREENRRLLKCLGRVVGLYATDEETYNRVSTDTGRPLLSEGDRDALMRKIEGMQRERLPYYEATADIRVDTTDRDMDRVISEIVG